MKTLKMRWQEPGRDGGWWSHLEITVNGEPTDVFVSLWSPDADTFKRGTEYGIDLDMEIASPYQIK